MKIKDLDREVQYSLVEISEEQAETLLIWLKANDKGWGGYTKKYLIEEGKHVLLGFNGDDWAFLCEEEEEPHLKKSILPLFYEEDEFIQGNVYLFSDNSENWEEGEFVVEWKECYYKVNHYDGSLIPYKYMKPIQKQEWYVIDRGLDKEFRQITEEDALILQAEEKRVVKVTNESLIKVLNEYGDVAEH